MKNDYTIPRYTVAAPIIGDDGTERLRDISRRPSDRNPGGLSSAIQALADLAGFAATCPPHAAIHRAQVARIDREGTLYPLTDEELAHGAELATMMYDAEAARD